jgi:hypothetical protein
MFELKKLTADGIADAIKKAERYRLLNEPRQAESICLDVLEVVPDDQRTLIVLLLARTDQFKRLNGSRVEDVRSLLPRLEDEYSRHYYAGIICERWAKAELTRNRMGSGPIVYQWLREAMEHYEDAEKLRRPGNDDPVLRWNSCARVINTHEQVKPAADEDFHPLLE